MISLVLQVVLGCTLAWAAIAKLRALDKFRNAVRDFAMVPATLVVPLSRMIPIAELVLGLLVLVGVQLRITAGIAALLLLAFTVAVVMNLRRGHRVSCACFGASDSPISAWVVLRNGCLLLAAVSVALGGPAGPLEPIEAIAAVLVAVVLMQGWSLVALARRVAKATNILGAASS